MITAAELRDLVAAWPADLRVTLVEGHYAHGPGIGVFDAATATFEVVFDETTGSFSYEYADVEYTATGTTPALCNGGACATIGLEQDDAWPNKTQFRSAKAIGRSLPRDG